MPNPGAENTVPPITAFRFEVLLTITASIAGVSSPVCDAAFQECSGLDMTMEPKTMTQGGDHQRQIHRIGPVTYGRLTLRRGMTSNHHLWHWFAAAAIPGKNPTASGQVRVLNADGSEALTFVLEACLPTKVSGPSLNAQTGQIALEELQLVYAFMTLKDAGAGGGGGGIGLNASAELSVSGGAGLSGSLSANAGFDFGSRN
jgi:phage tail-like protein